MPVCLPCTSSVQTTIEIKEPFYGANQIAIAYLGAAEVENYGTKKEALCASKRSSIVPGQRKPEEEEERKKESLTDTQLTEYFHELLAIRFSWFRAFGVCLSTMKAVAAP